MNKDAFDPSVRAILADFVPATDRHNACSYATRVDEITGDLKVGFSWSIDPRAWEVERVPEGVQAYDSEAVISAEMAEEATQQVPFTLERVHFSSLVEMAKLKPVELLADSGHQIGTSRFWYHRATCGACGGNNITSCIHCRSGKTHCTTCFSTGAVSCYSCAGAGTHQRVIDNNGHRSLHYERCSICSSTGKRTCDRCNGSGSCNCQYCAGTGLNTCGHCKGGYQITKMGYELSYRADIEARGRLLGLPSAVCVTSFGEPVVLSKEPLRLALPVTVHQASVNFNLYGERFEHKFWGQVFAPENSRQLTQQAFDALLGWLSNPLDKARVKAAKSTPIVKRLMSQIRSGINITAVNEVTTGTITQAQALQFDGYLKAISKTQGFAEKAVESLKGFFTRRAVQRAAAIPASSRASAWNEDGLNRTAQPAVKRAGLISRIWNGQIGAATLFWLYGLVGFHVWAVLVFMLDQVSKELGYWGSVLVVVYMIVVLVGTCRALFRRKSVAP